MDEFKLKLLTPDIDLEDKNIDYPDVNRPALQLAGFFDYFPFHRIQIIGRVEYAYMNKMKSDVRRVILRKIFSYKIPCIIICRGLEPFPEMLTYAKKNNVPILSSDESTTDFISELLRWLKVVLAPFTTMHGVLVDIYGEGVLILGESGLGKSETAVELIKRGHRFVADDVVEIRRVSKETLLGCAPEVLRYFMELRGIGIIDVKQMFGVESIKDIQRIDLVVKLELWDKASNYDRLGSNSEQIDILGNGVPCHVIPIRPGRNIAVICESAAINHRQQNLGYNTSDCFTSKIKFKE